MYHHDDWNLHNFMNKCLETDHTYYSWFCDIDELLLLVTEEAKLNIRKPYKSQMGVLIIAVRGKKHQQKGQIKGIGE